MKYNKRLYMLIAVPLVVWLLLSMGPSSRAEETTTLTVQGNIQLQGRTDHSGVTIIAAARSTTTDATGAFSITVDATGSYQITTAMPGYLSAVQGSTIATDVSALYAGMAYLPAGDVTADNKIDIFDVAFVAHNYDSNNPTADINGDGRVNITDIALTASNYGEQGPVSFKTPDDPVPTPTATAPSATNTPQPTSTPVDPTFTPTPESSTGGAGFGRVLDASGNAVSGATVTMSGSGSFTTDSNGYWAIGDIAAGTYDLQTSAPRMQSWPAARRTYLDSNSSPLLTLAPDTNAVENGDFEGASIYSDWPTTPTFLPTADAFDGDTAALLGSGTGQFVSCYQNNQPGQMWTMKQAVTVPNVSTPGVSFVHKINTTQSTFDYAWFEVVVEVNGQPNFLVPWGGIWQASGWNLLALDMSAWRGQTVDVIFRVVHCADATLTATIDRVAVGNINGQAVPIPGQDFDEVSKPSPTPVATVVPNVDYIGYARQLTACENNGKHHLFIYVRDGNGTGIPGVNVRVAWAGGEVVVQTGTKAEDPGLVDFPMFKGSYWVQVLDGSSEEVGPLTPDIPIDVPCLENGNPVGNSLFHYSYDVIFTKVR